MPPILYAHPFSSYCQKVLIAPGFLHAQQSLVSSTKHVRSASCFRWERRIGTEGRSPESGRRIERYAHDPVS